MPARRILATALVVAFVVVAVLAGRASPAAASPVATDDATYLLYGRVFPDPHGCVRGLPGKSPYAKGNVCATQFIQFPELIAGLRFLDSKFARFMEVFELPGESAGIPTTGSGRERSKLYAVRVTDELAIGAKKKFAFALSIHGIERAGAEGGTRAIEDLVTWATLEPARGLLQDTLGPGRSAVSVGDALARSEIWFFYPNPDGWVRGDVSRGGAAYQRYSGNGVDLNRDWPTSGYTFQPYTPASEPEVKEFIDFFKRGAPAGTGWAGTADLHGMLDAKAFTYTMLPAGQYDYARNQAVVSVARRIQEDAGPRLDWFLGIRPEQDSGSLPEVGQQWGTTWDTIEYTITGGLGDWFSNPVGLDAYVGMNNEMWVSHLAPNNVFVADLEQAHIDGNKGLIYAQIEGAFRDSARVIPLGGKIAYVDHGHRFRVQAAKQAKNRKKLEDLPPQESISTSMTSPQTATPLLSPTFEFDVFGPSSGVRSGGMKVEVTYLNADGISPADLLTAVHVERFDGDPHGGGGWETVQSHYNQNQAYLAAGHTVDVNEPAPGRWRVRFESLPPGVHSVDIGFSSGLAWADPGQVAYDVSSLRFFDELKPYLPAGTKLVRLSPNDILGGKDLSEFDSIILVNDPLPGWYDQAGAGGSPDPQPDETFTLVVPIPTADVNSPTDGTYEFDVLPEFNNQSMAIRIEWDIDSDYDLYVERLSANGRDWVVVGSSTQFLTSSESTAVAGMFAGRYRVRVDNYLGVAQEVRGTIDFRNTPGDLRPKDYPVTRTAEDAAKYYSRLRSFAEAGGNLLLTDGAARAVPYLTANAVTANDIKPVLVYAPYVSFRVTSPDGDAITYDDELARNVNQPGAAEGTGNRHQTVEPVPLGYAIQNEDGGNQGHSFTWAIRRAAWTAAGGRTVGTVADETALGELALGSGRIRFIGGLLPDPEDRYFHPYGLASYALTYTGWQLFENLATWRRP